MGIPRPARRWAARLGLLALAIQLAAAALPMPAAAGFAGLPAWLAASLCLGTPAQGSDDRPDPSGHAICPVCFVLAAAAGAVPPDPPAVALATPRPTAAPTMPHALGLPPQYAGTAALSRAPPSA